MRLDEVLNPIKREFDRVTTNLRVTGKPLFFWTDYRKELHNLHEGMEKSRAFDILRTRKPKLYAGIEGFFTNLENLERFENDMGVSIWDGIHDTVHSDDLGDSRPGYEREIFDMLFTAIALNWGEYHLIGKYAQKIREIFDYGELLVDDGPIYLSKAFGIVRDMEAVKEYVKYRRFFLKKKDDFLKVLSEQMERDKKLIPG